MIHSVRQFMSITFYSIVYICTLCAAQNSPDTVSLAVAGSIIRLTQAEAQYLASLSQPFKQLLAQQAQQPYIKIPSTVTREAFLFIKNHLSILNEPHTWLQSQGFMDINKDMPAASNPNLAQDLQKLSLLSLAHIINAADILNIQLLLESAIHIFSTKFIAKPSVDALAKRISFIKELSFLDTLTFSPAIMERIKTSIDLSWLIQKHMQRKINETIDLKALSHVYLTWKQKKQPVIRVNPTTHYNRIALLGRFSTLIIDLDSSTIVPLSFALKDLCWNPDGSHIAACFGTRLLIFDTQRGNKTLTISLNNRLCLETMWSAQNQLIALTQSPIDPQQRYIDIFDTAKGTKITTIDLSSLTGSVTTISTDPTGKFLQISTATTVNIWHVPTVKLVHTVHLSTPQLFSWNPVYSAFALSDNTGFSIYDIASDKTFTIRATLTINNLITQIAWNPHGNMIAVSSARTITIFNTQTNNKIQTIQTPVPYAIPLIWSPNNDYIAAHHNVWNIYTGLNIVTTKEPIQAWTPSGTYIIAGYHAIPIIEPSFIHALTRISFLQMQLLQYMYIHGITDVHKLPDYMKPIFKKLPKSIRSLSLSSLT